MDQKQILKEFTPMDDLFAQLFFDDAKVIEEILRLILGKRLKIIDYHLQHRIENPGRRSVVFDIFAESEDQTLFDIEIQKGSSEIIRRMRGYGSMMDIAKIGPGENFSKLPERIVIFITEHDTIVSENPRPLYKFVYFDVDSKVFLNDGTAFVLLSTDPKHQNSTELGELIHDMQEHTPNHMHNKVLRKRMAWLKEERGGIEMVGHVMEKYTESINREWERRLAAEKEAWENRSITEQKEFESQLTEKQKEFESQLTEKQKEFESQLAEKQRECEEKDRLIRELLQKKTENKTF